MNPFRTLPRAPWWAYAVPFAAANLLRQLLVPPDEVGDVVSIALFAATAVVVALVVTAAHAARRRGVPTAARQQIRPRRS